MKPGFCYIAERAEPSQTAQRIIVSFNRVGIVLVNPHSGRVTELADDGEQVDTTEGDILRAAAARPESSFQLWFSSDTDVVCGLRQIAPDLIRHGYSVDGLDAGERERLMRWAVEYFREAAAAGTAILLVVDPPGITAEVDWDAVVSQKIAFPRTLPPILGLPASWVRHLGDLSSYSRKRMGDFELLTMKSSALGELLDSW